MARSKNGENKVSLGDQLDRIVMEERLSRREYTDRTSRARSVLESLSRGLQSHTGENLDSEAVSEIVQTLKLKLNSEWTHLSDAEEFLSRLSASERSTMELAGEARYWKHRGDEAKDTIQESRQISRRMTETVEMAEGELAKLRKEVEKLKEPPLPFGIYLGPGEQDGTVVVNSGGKEYEVQVANASIDISNLRPGARLLLNKALNVLDVSDNSPVGDVAIIREVLSDGRVLVKPRESEVVVTRVSWALSQERLRVGDHVRHDTHSGMIFEILPKSEVEDVVLEEVPDVSFEQIGGLTVEIEKIKDAIELPFIYAHLFKVYQLKPPKGILLYGPPGCGKTLIAKAVANSLAGRVRRFLEENIEAILLLQELENGASYSDIRERLEKLKRQTYDHQALYKHMEEKETEELYEELDKSGIIGDFIRRTEGDQDEPSLSCKIQDWLDFLMELKHRGFGKLTDANRLGTMVDKKRTEYFLNRRKVADEEYAIRWLKDTLEHRNVDTGDLQVALDGFKKKLASQIESYFLNIKGPELLNKYVGETEYRIREVFLKAREKASYGLPVIVFFDEIESMFRARGSGISSDIESTIVPMFLSEIDGVEGLDNVIVIGASNRQDLIDPAVLRPGRLDVKIRIDRPDTEAAREIFSKYLEPSLPLAEDELAEHDGDPKKLLAHMIDNAVGEMYETKKENEFLRVRYRGGAEEILYFKDFASGAMIEGIVSRAKKRAVKRMVIAGQKGLRSEDLLLAIRGEYQENEDLPNTTNPDDWARISGRRGESIVEIDTLLEKDSDTKKESEEIAVTSRYL